VAFVVMVWQIIFIAQLLLVTGKNIIGLFPTSGPIGYLLLTSDLIGYVFIFLMAATSFDIGEGICHFSTGNVFIGSHLVFVVLLFLYVWFAYDEARKS
jgi:hypothetical protein